MHGVWVLALALAGCSTGELVVDSVTPDAIAPQLATTVTVRGAGFVNRLRGSVDNQPFEIARTYVVTVGPVVASAVSRVDDQVLTVDLPPLDEGTYDVSVQRPDGRSATLVDGLRVAADDLGVAEDLAGIDEGGALDLLGVDSSGSDGSMMCNPPMLPSNVGPGPNLGIRLSGIKLNGGNNFAHVAAGAQFSVTAQYKLTDGTNSRDQIIFGVAPSTPQVCFFDAQVTGGAAMGSATTTMTAPSQPGTYTLRFHYGQDSSCNLSWWTMGGAPTSAEDFAAICVP